MEVPASFALTYDLKLNHLKHMEAPLDCVGVGMGGRGPLLKAPSRGSSATLAPVLALSHPLVTTSAS